MKARTYAGAALDRLLSERQFTELRRYEDGHPRWISGGPLRSLVDKGYLRPSEHDPMMHAVTRAGRTALARFREHYAVRDDVEGYGR